MLGGLSDALLLEDAKRFEAPYPIAAIDNFVRIFAIHPEDRVLLLVDRGLDRRVIDFVAQYARGRGAAVQVVMGERGGNPSGGNSASTEVPDELKPVLEWATFVVSTWFASVSHPFCKALRRERGQRWIKITFFRNLDYLRTEAAAFPLDVITLLLQRTAARYPQDGPADIRITDPRGTDLRIHLTQSEVSRLLSQSRWKGELTAERPGCYVHYLPTHGPNFVDTNTGVGGERVRQIEGVLIPQWSVGFVAPFQNPPIIEMAENQVTAVRGEGEVAEILRQTLIGATLDELGCGFNPKFPRHQIYPAGPNAPGGLHFGMNMVAPSPFVLRRMPEWVEPPVHMDLVDLDATVTINGQTVVDQGFLTTLRDPVVQAAAARYGDPHYLLEGDWV